MGDEVLDVTGRHISALWLHSTDAPASASYLSQNMQALGAPPAPGFAEVRFVAMAGSGGLPVGALDAFWKFSVFTDDIVGLRSTLVDTGRTVTEPVQFGDIGYLCHLEEPGGNAIELLQRTFKDNPVATPASPDSLGLITLRVHDVDTSLAFYQQGLGMRLLSTMAVDDGRADPFDLYFLGWSDESGPDTDVGAVANREWAYQRRSTLIELQHYRHDPDELISGSANGSRLAQIDLAVSDHVVMEQDLAALGVAVERDSGSITFTSPDGHHFFAGAQKARPIN